MAVVLNHLEGGNLSFLNDILKLREEIISGEKKSSKKVQIELLQKEVEELRKENELLRQQLRPPSPSIGLCSAESSSSHESEETQQQEHISSIIPLDDGSVAWLAGEEDAWKKSYDEEDQLVDN